MKYRAGKRSGERGEATGRKTRIEREAHGERWDVGTGKIKAEWCRVKGNVREDAAPTALLQRLTEPLKPCVLYVFAL